MREQKRETKDRVAKKQKSQQVQLTTPSQTVINHKQTARKKLLSPGILSSKISKTINCQGTRELKYRPFQGVQRWI